MVSCMHRQKSSYNIIIEMALNFLTHKGVEIKGWNNLSSITFIYMLIGLFFTFVK